MKKLSAKIRELDSSKIFAKFADGFKYALQQ